MKKSSKGQTKTKVKVKDLKPKKSGDVKGGIVRRRLESN